MALISCKGVSFSYEGRQAVSGLDFSVNEGDYLCIVGENGSGKSTLLKGILRLMSPQSGSIEYGNGLKPNEIGYMPQQTPAQRDFPASVHEVILSGRLSSSGKRPFYSNKDKLAAHEYLRLLHIDGMQSRCYRELSGGQQQRVLLARALCAAKRLLLLDEPAAGLDPVVTHELYNIIERINRETGMTVIMVSHDIQSAVKYASHILHLNRGQAYFGNTAEYAKSAAGRMFIGEDNA